MTPEKTQSLKKNVQITIKINLLLGHKKTMNHFSRKIIIQIIFANQSKVKLKTEILANIF